LNSTQNNSSVDPRALPIFTLFGIDAQAESATINTNEEMNSLHDAKKYTQEELLTLMMDNIKHDTYLSGRSLADMSKA
jgi:hypothetical protein